MTPVVGHVVRMAGGQCAPDDMGGGWVCRIWGAGRVPHLAIRHNAPGPTRAWCALKVIVCSLVQVQPWSSPESHVAGAQGSWVTAGAEAAYPAVQEGQISRPPPQVNPAASGGEPARDKRVPSLARQAKAREGVKTPETPPRRTLRRRGSGMLRQEPVAQGRSQAVSGPHRLRPVVYGSAEVPGEAV